MHEQTLRSFKDARILVLGGSGVIGSRLVEVLVRKMGADVSVLVRNLAKAVRIARYPVSLIHGDVADPAILKNAMTDKDLVIDLTFPKEGGFKERCEMGLGMARTIGRTAAQSGIRRLVHLSTISVYGRPSGTVLDETMPRQPGKDPYGASKLAGENEMVRLHREEGVPVVILQPTIVYGPFAGWSAGPISQLSNGRFVLPEEGQGTCNAVYIDDVVRAILRAALAGGVEGEVFLISGDPPVTWKEFYGAYEEMLGFTSTVSMSETEIINTLDAKMRAARPIRRLLKTLRQDAELRQIALGLPGIAQFYGLIKYFSSDENLERIKDRMLDRRNGGTEQIKPLIFPTRVQLGIFVPETKVSIEKAREQLGYAPIFDLKSGMELTRSWARWARLLSASV